jgi:hypothetical protein
MKASQMQTRLGQGWLIVAPQRGTLPPNEQATSAAAAALIDKKLRQTNIAAGCSGCE